MKRKTIDRIIEDNGSVRLDFDNEDIMLTWYVAIGEGYMVARRELEANDGKTTVDYVSSKYADVMACEEIYEEIVLDFVDCYTDALREGSAGDLGLFSDVANSGDDGLTHVLSLFGKTYAEFLLDVFFWYGSVVEMECLLCDDDFCDCAEMGIQDDLACSECFHFTKKVLAHLAKDAILIEYDFDDDEHLEILWRFAKVGEQLFYCATEIEYDNYVCSRYEDCGSIRLDDTDGFTALRDAVISSFDNKDNWGYSTTGAPFELFDIKLEDIL